MVKLGYACINETLAKQGISCNKSCTLKTIKSQSDPWKFLYEKCLQNLSALKKIIEWNIQHNILFYRMSSAMFPHIGNPKLIEIIGKEKWYEYISLKPFKSFLLEIKVIARKCRLSVHPGQYCQLASPKQQVVENSKIDLLWHANLLRYVGDKNSTICIHGGGTWGDKKSALIRLEKELLSLSNRILSRVCLENCEKSWSAEELLPICKKVGIPLIFDFFHYKCYREKQRPIKELLPEILATWKDKRPKFHISEQDPNKKLGAHSEFVYNIPIELVELSRGFDIMIEAKRKEACVFLLREWLK